MIILFFCFSSSSRQLSLRLPGPNISPLSESSCLRTFSLPFLGRAPLLPFLGRASPFCSPRLSGSLFFPLLGRFFPFFCSPRFSGSLFFPLAGSIFYFHFSFIPPRSGLSSCFFSSFLALLARTILVPSPPFLAQTFSSSRVELFYKISSPSRVKAYIFFFSLRLSGPFHSFSGSILSLSLQTDILSYVLVFLRLSGSNISPLTGLFSFSFLRFSS